MIAEGSRPATRDDLQRLDDRRIRVLWAGGTPWGCMLWAPAGVTGLVAILAVPFAAISRDWRVVGIAAAAALAITGFVAWSLALLELARIAWAASRRDARTALHPPIRTLRASARRAWVVADVAGPDWAPYIAFDAGDGDLLCIDAGLALRAAGHDTPRDPPADLPGDVEVSVEPAAKEWPLDVKLSGARIPLTDLLNAEEPAVLLSGLEGRRFPMLLRLGEVTPRMREIVESAG